MSKRYQPPKEFERIVKKPRLDITINKGRPATNSNTTLRTLPKIPADNFWDDEDDDVILLATQIAESQVAGNTKPIITTITESEITFSEFAPNLDNNGATSTQWPQKAQQPKKSGMLDDLLSQVFENDDDDVDFTMLAIEAEKKQTTTNEMDDGFKVPDLPFSKTQKITGNNNLRLSVPQSTANTGGVPLSQSQAIRLQTSEREIKYLMDRIETLKMQNKKLNADYDDIKTKMEGKEGEAALLRDELRHTKQQMQTLKMEKIFSTEVAKTECKTKIHQLSKVVEAKEAQLQLKNIECSMLKMRHADETKRFEESIRIVEPAAEVAPQEPSLSKTFLRDVMILHDLQIDELPKITSFDSFHLHLNEHLFEQTIDSAPNKIHRTIFQMEFDILQAIVAQISFKLNGHESISVQEENSYIDTILESVCKAFSEFWTYVHTLGFPKSCRTQRNHDYNFMKDTSDENRVTVQQAEQLHIGEHVINFRRYVAALAIVCGQLPKFSVCFIMRKHGEYLLLQIANEAIYKLGFANELIEHFGLVESFAFLLNKMLLIFSTSTSKDMLEQQHIELIVNFLKQLVFIRPSPWILCEISYCLMHCMRWPAVLEQLCINSAETTFKSDRVGLVYKFSADTCFLQIFASLLEIAFPFNVVLREKQFDLMTVISQNYVRFIFDCFTHPPTFIKNMLPAYDEEDEDNQIVAETETVSGTNTAQQISTNSSSTSSITCSTVTSTNAIRDTSNVVTCECYIKLCLSVVTLLFQMMRQWLHYDKVFLTERICVISRLSVKLLHTIFCDNYLLRLFRNSEETTKHYLQLICTWWAENAEILNFGQIEMDFLRKIRDSHFMPRSIIDDANLQNINSDLMEYERLAKDFNTCDNKENNNKEEKNKPVDDIIEPFDPSILLKDAFDEDKFFACFKGFAFNFE